MDAADLMDDRRAQTVTAELIRLQLSRRFTEAGLHLPLEAFIESTGHGLEAAIRARILGNRTDIKRVEYPVTVSVQVPATWRDHLLRDLLDTRFGAWLRRRFPWTPRPKTRTIQKTEIVRDEFPVRWVTCPHLPIAVEDHHREMRFAVVDALMDQTLGPPWGTDADPRLRHLRFLAGKNDPSLPGEIAKLMVDQATRKS